VELLPLPLLRLHHHHHHRHRRCGCCGYSSSCWTVAAVVVEDVVGAATVLVGVLAH
jgi:hypothetical protein